MLTKSHQKDILFFKYNDESLYHIRPKSGKGEILLHVTKEHIDAYLSDVRTAVEAGNYQIASRYKNMDIYIDYLFTEEDAKKVLLSLDAEDFSAAVPNAHPGHSEEVLYIFGKGKTLMPRFGGEEERVPFYIKLNKLKRDKPAGQYVAVISMHRQKHSLFYPFKVRAGEKRMGRKEHCRQDGRENTILRGMRPGNAV